MDLDKILAVVLECVEVSSKAIMEIYSSTALVNVQKKADKSPVTKADLISNQIISDMLSSAFSYPLLTEESRDDLSRLGSPVIWMIDPLDGTKEFLSKIDEFTVNIALVKDKRSILSAISIPAENTFYYAIQGAGAYVKHNGIEKKIVCSSVSALKETRLSVSRSHLNPQLDQLLKNTDILHFIPMGSALKYCAIAGAEADASLRKTPLMEWDICAADCILTEAGGVITDFSGSRLSYNQKTPIFDRGIVASNSLLQASLLDLVRPLQGLV